MRLHRVVPMLAAAVTLAGSTAPASAFDNRAPELGPTNLVSHSSGGSSSSALTDIGAGLVAGAAIGAGGLAAFQRRSSVAKGRASGLAAGRS
jgi:hypothetical protein